MKKRIFAFTDNHPYWFLFLTSFAMIMLMLIPVIIVNGGYFAYYSDYNYAQIGAYVQYPDLIKNGDIFGWGMSSALGNDNYAAGAFGGFTSPIVWALMLVPKQEYIYFILPYIFALKYALSSVFAFMYIKRFVKNQNAAMIGAYIYAFAGFMNNNIMYPSFNEVFAFFPLLLVAMEEAVQKNKKLVFALAVAFMAIIHWYMFVSEVVFCLIYFFFRADVPGMLNNLLVKLNTKEGYKSKIPLEKRELKNKDFPLTGKKFFFLALEAVIGVMIAAVIFMPVYQLLAENPRVEDGLVGTGLIAYDDRMNFLLAELIRSLFMIPDMSVFNSLFPISWTFSSGVIFLPLFGIVGVLAFFKTNKSHWAKTISIFCMIVCFFPGLVLLFYMFQGSSVYFRWLFMPILIAALMTAKALENLQNENERLPITAPKGRIAKGWSFGFKVTFLAIAAYAVVGWLPDRVLTTESENDITFENNVNTVEYVDKWGEFPVDKMSFWTGFVIVFILYILLAITIKRKQLGKKLVLLTIIGTFCCTIFTFYNVYYRSNFNEENFLKVPYIEKFIKTDLALPEDEFYRVNSPMSSSETGATPSKAPNINFWGSSLNVGTMKFYEHFNNQPSTSVFTTDIQQYGLNGLFSVRYFIEHPDSKVLSNDFTNVKKVLPNIEKVNTVNGWDIYELADYVPMGFAFDYYITQDYVNAYNNKRLGEIIKEGSLFPPATSGNVNEWFKSTYKEDYESDLSKEPEDTVITSSDLSIVNTNALIKALQITEKQAEKYADIIKILPVDEYFVTKDEYAEVCAERRSMSCYSFEYDNYGFTGKINLDKERLVFFSVPYSTGWSATVNGEPVEIETVDIGFMAVKVPVGDSTIKFSYETPGMNTGIIISAGGIALFLLYALALAISKLIKKKKN